MTPAPARNMSLTWIVGVLGIVVLHCALAVSTEVAVADEPAVVGQLSMTCSVNTINGTHKPLSSDYAITGQCLLFETSSRGGTAQVNNVAVHWTVQASHQPNTKATFETMNLALSEFGKTTATGTVSSTMQCGSDPWRIMPNGPCRLVTRKTSPPSFPGYVSMAYQQLLQEAPNLPLSFKLNPAQRAAIDKQYHIAMAAQQTFDPSQTTLSKPQGPGVAPFTPGGPNTSDAILSRQMPRILSPASGATVVVGQLLVKIQPPLIGKEPVAELEFAWLDTPAGQPRFVNTIPAMDTAKLLQGQYIDPKVTRLNYGRWEMRVRMIGQGAVAGPWSAPASFTLVPNQQNQSIQTPSPASPLLKSPSERFGAGTSVIRPRGLNREKSEPSDSAATPAE
ncbi:MAG TPA: hypothetical protein PLY42_10570 [Nitrospira sp.]|nr:hypothetical protein [Nitrospira sp.]MCW5795246.1 hypothetical protein [Nitrospira sp.]HMU32000.1 hypothetical protein [Nitrospira sp.]HMX91800.1 hypothetical protein [Nitrospira sp.]HMZ98168.1 hypothetical protein [Nitrospira sp.]